MTAGASVNPATREPSAAYRAAMGSLTEHDRARPAALPAARHLAITWGIPDEYGGMTAALLHRSRAFHRAGGADVDVITFDERPDYPAVRERLRERGALCDGIRILNVYEHFRDVEREAVSGIHRPASMRRPPDEAVRGDSGSVLRWVEKDEAVRVEHRRLDGTTAVVDEHRRGGGRIITSLDRAGNPTGQWRTARAFRFAWLDELIADAPAVAIVDSKTAAAQLQHYWRPNVTLIHVVHGAHADRRGRLTATRRPVFENLHRWDAVAFLTKTQRAAAIELLGDPGNLVVAPNGVTVAPDVPRLPSDRLHGVIVSRLTSAKRIEHSLRIIAAVRARGVPLTADIVGDGPRRAVLEAEAARLGLDHAVQFAGYREDVRDFVRRGSWTLVTSRSEGESLALLEAMAVGSVPVAYAIPYGPAEVIDDGRNGWLVPEGDIEATAAALAHLCSQDDDSLAEMRRHARDTARRYDDAGIADLWAGIERDAVERHVRRTPVDDDALRRIRVRMRRGRYVVTGVLRDARSAPAVEVRLVSPRGFATRALMRGSGPVRYARVPERDSVRLGGDAVRTTFLVSTKDGTVTVDAGLRHPDRRSLPRRVLDLARRLVGGGAGQSSSSAGSSRIDATSAMNRDIPSPSITR